MKHSRTAQQFLITNEFWNWISPLLYYPEDEILLNHIEMTVKGFRLINPRKAQQKYNLTHRGLRKIRDKLSWLTVLYELEVASFPDSFS